MGSEIENTTQMYIEANLIKKVNVGDIVSDFMLNLENHAKEIVSYDEQNTNSEDKNYPCYNEKYERKLNNNITDMIGIIVINDESTDILFDFIKIRMDEINNNDKSF